MGSETEGGGEVERECVGVGGRAGLVSLWRARTGDGGKEMEKWVSRRWTADK